MRGTGHGWAALVARRPDGTEAVVALVPPGRPDLALVDRLTRLGLAAIRGGDRVRLLGASPELRGLLELVGLAEALGLEPRGEPELREELWEEEVMEPGDPPA